MNRFLAFISALVQCRTLIYPAVIGFVGSLVHVIGLNVEVEQKVVKLIDSAFTLLAAGVTVWGVMADMQNAKTKSAITATRQAIDDTNATAAVAATRADVAAVKADVAATKLTEVAQAVNVNAEQLDQITPPSMNAAKVSPPPQVKQP